MPENDDDNDLFNQTDFSWDSTIPGDIPPHLILLAEMGNLIGAVDYEVQAGLAKPLTVRHSRNRKPAKSERPLLSIIFVGDDLRPDDVDRNTWEEVRELSVDLQVDLDLETETSFADPTGLLYLSLVLAAAVKSLKDAEQPVFLGGLCDWIRVGSIDPEERSTPDVGRMTRALTVIYRVRSDDANVLLASGENG